MSGHLSELGKRTAAIINLDRRMALDAEVRIGYKAHTTGQEISETPFQTAKQRMLDSRKLLAENKVAPLEVPLP